MNRAFSAFPREPNSWGDAPGSGETAALALNTYSLAGRGHVRVCTAEFALPRAK